MVKSRKGKDVNMQALVLANQYSVALGNARMNARGDLLGRNGEIVKTREELGQEYNTAPVNKVVSVPLTQDITVNKTDKKKPAAKTESEEE